MTAIRGQLLQQLGRLPMSFEATAEAKKEWELFYLGMPSSEHVKRLDTLGFRLLALIALTTGKTAIDTGTVVTVRSILDYELKMRELTDPIDADNTIAKLENKVRRVLLVKGPQKPRDLKKAVNANRSGLWAYDKAVQNLRSAGKVKPNPDGTLELLV